MAPREHYRSLARQYALLADHAANALLADGYRKLADGYLVLAEVGEAANIAEPGEISPGAAGEVPVGKQDA